MARLIGRLPYGLNSPGGRIRIGSNKVICCSFHVAAVTTQRAWMSYRLRLYAELTYFTSLFANHQRSSLPFWLGKLDNHPFNDSFSKRPRDPSNSA